MKTIAICKAGAVRLTTRSHYCYGMFLLPLAVTRPRAIADYMIVTRTGEASDAARARAAIDALRGQRVGG